MIDRSRPFIDVSVNGRPVSDAFYSRLKSASITDAPGQNADTCELVFDDAGNDIQIPQAGAKLAVRFGFRDAGTWKMGTFVIEKSAISGGPDGELVTLSGRSADMRSDVKEPLSEHFDNATIGQIVEQLARRHGHRSKVSPELSSVKLEYVARTEQSSLDFLTRLADKHAALFSVKDNAFLFLSRGGLPPVTINKSECQSWDFEIEPRPKFGAAVAGWYERPSNTVRFERHSTGLDGPARRLRTIFASQQEAVAAARSEGDRLGRATGSGSLTLAGMPEVMADAPIITTGFRSEINGEWRASSVVHAFQDTYMTTIELEAPEKGKR